jgi:cytidylate kinase
LDRIQQIKPDISITDKTRLCSLHFEDNICGKDSIPTKVFLEGKEWQSIKIKEEKVDENLNNTEVTSTVSNLSVMSVTCITSHW